MANRRGHGEGSITKRADGRWQARVDLGYEGGRRVRKSFYGKTRKEVADKLTKALNDHRQQIPLPNERQTVAQYLGRWLEDSVRPSARPKTYISYEYVCRVHLVPELGRIPLTRLEPQDVQHMMSRKLTAGLSPRTTAYLRVVLRCALNQAIAWRLLAVNVAALAKPPKIERVEVRPLDPEQARAFLDATRGHRLEALYSVALAVGLREGEALGLSWEDIDLDKRTLTVRRQLQRVDRQLQLVEPKTAKSRRTVVLPLAVVERLRTHKVRQAEERLRAREWEESGLVFTAKNGKPVHPENLGRSLKPLLQRAGLPPQRFHDLRHACASLLFAQGVPAKSVMETLGHTQLSTTSDLYGHMFMEVRRDVADRMDAILGAVE